MIIVLEGPDGAGKSTLGNLLSQAFNIPVFHTGGPPQDIGEFYDKVESVYDAIDSVPYPEPVIFDRLPHISEFAYGNGRVLTDDRLLKDFELFCDRIRPYIIYCKTDPQTMVAAMIAGKPHKPETWMRHVVENAPRIHARYDDFFRRFPPNSIYNYQETKADVRTLPVL